MSEMDSFFETIAEVSPTVLSEGMPWGSTQKDVDEFVGVGVYWDTIY